MAELLPELERRDQRPDVIVGTSVGAINCGPPPVIRAGGDEDEPRET